MTLIAAFATSSNLWNSPVHSSQNFAREKLPVPKTAHQPGDNCNCQQHKQTSPIHDQTGLLSLWLTVCHQYFPWTFTLLHVSLKNTTKRSLSKDNSFLNYWRNKMQNLSCMKNRFSVGVSLSAFRPDALETMEPEKLGRPAQTNPNYSWELSYRTLRKQASLG